MTARVRRRPSNTPANLVEEDGVAFIYQQLGKPTSTAAI